MIPLRWLAMILVLPACSVSMTTPEAAGPMPTGSNGPGNTMLERGTDPICGIEYKWNGSRCIREGAEDPVKKGGKLDLIDVVGGTGPDARPGDAVSVHYVGTLEDGTKFDSSRDAGRALEFKIGMGQVIKGFERGIVGMKVGGVRKITIPP